MNKLKEIIKTKDLRNPVWLNRKEFLFICNESGFYEIWKFNVESNKSKQVTDYKSFILDIKTNIENSSYVFTMNENGTEKNQLYYIDTSDNKPVNLTREPEAIHISGDFIKNSDLFVFTSNLRDGKNFDLELINLKNRKREILVKNDDGYNFVESISPGGRYIIYRKLLSKNNQPLWCYDRETKNISPINLSLSENKNCLWLNNSTIYYLTNKDNEFMYLEKYNLKTREFDTVLKLDYDIVTFSFSNCRKYISIVINKEGYFKLKVYKLKKFNEININNIPLGVVTYYDSISWNPIDRKFLFTYSNINNLYNIWELDLDKKEIRVVTDNKLDLENNKLDLRKYKSFDNLTIPYWLYYSNKNKLDKAPVIIYIHGGPESQHIASFNSIISYFISEGYVIVAPNIRGSTGYGKTYISLDDREKRINCFLDVKYLVQDLIKNNIGDKRKFIITGVSYGGFVALSSIGYFPDLFSGAISISGMYNLVSFLKNTPSFRQKHREQEYGFLEKDSQKMYKISPISQVSKINCPIFISHGKNDMRIPVSEAKVYVDKLLKEDKNVEYVEYEDEGHGFNNYKNKFDLCLRISNFLNKIITK